MDPRDTRLNEPHVKPLMDLVRGIRSRRREKVPNVDPNDGGVNAVALFLSETPGPRAVGTGYVSRDNPDLSAKHMGEALDAAGFSRSDLVLWNVVPYCVSTEARNMNATAAEIKEAAPDTQVFIDTLPRLRVIVFCGLQAQRAIRHLAFPPGVQALRTFHCGAQSYNHGRCREDIRATFATAWELMG